MFAFTLTCASVRKHLLIRPRQRCLDSLYKKAHQSLKSPLCSCVSVALPDSSSTRITALCDRLRCLAYPIAFATALASPYHSRPNGSASEIRSAPVLIFAGAHFVNVHLFTAILAKARVKGTVYCAERPKQILNLRRHGSRCCICGIDLSRLKRAQDSSRRSWPVIPCPPAIKNDSNAIL